MRVRPAYLVPVALLGLLTACGGNDDPAAASTGTSTPAAASTPSTATTPSAGAAGGNELEATVGEGDAFTISLTDSSGAPVSTLKPGSYTVKVSDKSKIHNFHLTGPGVEQKTTVPDVSDTTWTVDLTAGTYTFTCDPHAKMTGTFTVA
jgi:plastocyanin